MKTIVIATIPHRNQRYPTVGDWIVDHELLSILVSDMKNHDYEFLVGLHELIESYLCIKRNIRQEEVDQFDMTYENNRTRGDDSEPGDSKKAPYFKEHQFATKIEKLVAKELRVPWKKYNQTVSAL